MTTRFIAKTYTFLYLLAKTPLDYVIAFGDRNESQHCEMVL